MTTITTVKQIVLDPDLSPENSNVYNFVRKHMGVSSNWDTHGVIPREWDVAYPGIRPNAPNDDNHSQGQCTAWNDHDRNYYFNPADQKVYITDAFSPGIFHTIHCACTAPVSDCPCYVLDYDVVESSAYFAEITHNFRHLRKIWANGTGHKDDGFIPGLEPLHPVLLIPVHLLPQHMFVAYCLQGLIL